MDTVIKEQEKINKENYRVKKELLKDIDGLKKKISILEDKKNLLTSLTFWDRLVFQDIYDGLLFDKKSLLNRLKEVKEKQEFLNRIRRLRKKENDKRNKHKLLTFSEREAKKKRRLHREVITSRNRKPKRVSKREEKAFIKEATAFLRQNGWTI